MGPWGNSKLLPLQARTHQYTADRLRIRQVDDMRSKVASIGTLIKTVAIKKTKSFHLFARKKADNKEGTRQPALLSMWLTCAREDGQMDWRCWTWLTLSPLAPACRVTAPGTASMVTGNWGRSERGVHASCSLMNGLHLYSNYFRDSVQVPVTITSPIIRTWPHH